MEKRRFPRFTVTDSHCNVLSETEVDILNMSLGGIALMAGVRLEMDREYTLKIEDNNKVITVRGQVVWSVLGGSAKGPGGDELPLYEAGLKFTPVSGEAAPGILDFLESHKILQDERSVARFDIRLPELAILHYPYRCSVVKISLGGMLIRTGKPFVVEDSFPVELFLGEDRSIRAYGRVASCVRAAEETGEVYDVGIEFLELNEEHREALSLFIETLQRA